MATAIATTPRAFIKTPEVTITGALATYRLAFTSGSHVHVHTVDTATYRTGDYDVSVHAWNANGEWSTVRQLDGDTWPRDHARITRTWPHPKAFDPAPKTHHAAILADALAAIDTALTQQPDILARADVAERSNHLCTLEEREAALAKEWETMQAALTRQRALLSVAKRGLDTFNA